MTNKCKDLGLKKYLDVQAYGTKVSSSLKKKTGDDKLVVSLILIVIGCVLCFFYRDKVTTLMSTAISTLTTKLSGLFSKLS